MYLFGKILFFSETKYFLHCNVQLGLSCSSVGKESTCNVEDPGLIPGSGKSLGEGIGYPLQYSWTSLVAHLVKSLPAMQETWVRSLGWGDPLEKGIAPHSSILSWRVTESWARLSDFHFLSCPASVCMF